MYYTNQSFNAGNDRSIVVGIETRHVALRCIFAGRSYDTTTTTTTTTTIKAKFHYASWFGASCELAPNMFRASSELASVMEFGFY